MQYINSQNFEELLNTSGLIALSFSGSWCKHCSIMSFIYEKIDHDRTDLNFYKVDVDINKDIVQMYNIKSIPTVVLLNDGKKIGQFTGSLSEQEILNKFEEFCSN